MQALQQLNPDLTVALVSIAIAVIAVIAMFLKGRQLNVVDAENQRLEAVAVRAREILAVAPDGLFLWDHVLGGITCSRRLAELLDLEAGTRARYDDIRSQFDGAALRDLERSISGLRGTGAAFDILLLQRDRVLQAIGSRAETRNGKPVADIVWLRDVTNTVDSNGGVTAENSSGLDDRHLTSLLDTLPMPIWLRDSELRLAFVNTAGQSLIDSEPGLAERARSGGQAVTERRLLDDAGTARLLEMTEIPFGQSGGVLSAGTLGFAIERTEAASETADTALWASPEAVLESLSLGIAVFDDETRLVSFNSAFVSMWKLDAEWLHQRPDFSELLDRLRDLRQLPEVTDFKALKAQGLVQFKALAEAGSPPLSELMHLPDTRTVRRTATSGGNGGLIIAYEDVSQQYSLERSVNELDAVQRETLDNLSEAIAVFGGDGRLKLSNPTYAKLWDFEAAGFLESEPHITEVADRMRALMPPPGNTEGWTDGSWSAYRDAMIPDWLSRNSGAGHLRLANGTEVDFINVPLPNGAVLLSYQDVTASARIEQALREKAEAFREADRLKSEFIATVSHEARTPLTTIIGFADILNQNYFGELNPRQQDYAEGILNTSRSLITVIGDILDLASIEAGRIELERDSIDIHALLAAGLQLVQERTRRKNIRVTFDCAPDIGWMTGDEIRLKQVLFNLLSNAVTFTPRRGGIRLDGKRIADQVIFSVSDTGVGIPQGDRERLFRPFSRGHKSVSKIAELKNLSGEDGNQGPGLGLTIVKNFIDLHGGEVEIKSLQHRGTSVTCRLPLTPPEQPSDNSEQ